MQRWVLLFLVVLLAGCRPETDRVNFNEVLEKYQQQYAPDSRTAIFDIQSAFINDTIVIKGETNLSGAREKLILELRDTYPNLVDSIRLLPDEELGEEYQAVVNLSVANIRSKPGHSAELATQATLGTPLKVFKKQDGWFLVQTPDQYLGWLDFGGLALMNETEFADWQQAPKVVFEPMYGFVYDSTGTHLSDVVAGNILRLTGQNDTAYQVQFPDGRSGYMQDEHGKLYGEWLAGLDPAPDRLINTARAMMGLPYLWGGTSMKGVDCSGFTKTIYFLNGLIIPRDASQQVRSGILVDDQKEWGKLEPGDLLFFGKAATDSTSERVVHVGMWIGDQEYIHSSGRVLINSMNPQADNFDEYNFNRYLRTKRILEGDNQEEISSVTELYPRSE